MSTVLLWALVYAVVAIGGLIWFLAARRRNRRIAFRYMDAQIAAELDLLNKEIQRSLQSSPGRRDA